MKELKTFLQQMLTAEGKAHGEVTRTSLRRMNAIQMGGAGEGQDEPIAYPGGGGQPACAIPSETFSGCALATKP